MKKAGEILKSLLERSHSGPGGAYSSLFNGWPAVAGVSLAEHSRILDVQNSCLLVEVDHPGWNQMLQVRKNEILRRLRKDYPQLGIRELKVRVSQKLTPPPEGRGRVEEESQLQKAEGEEPRDSEIERIVSLVKEEKLKGALRRLFLGALKRERGKEDH